MQLEDARFTSAIQDILEECRRARAKHGPFRSQHELYGVLMEEVMEWFETVRLDKPDDRELVSIAAMAILGLVELGGENINNDYILASLDEDAGTGNPSEA